MTQQPPSCRPEHHAAPDAGKPPVAAPDGSPRARPRTNDMFPTTVAWLGTRVAEGARGTDEANRHIMALYAHPLKVYFLGSTIRWVGEPDDVVQGFFADRLSRPDFLNKWVASQRPLRFWLITGFKFYLMESAREVQRRRAVGSIDAGSTTGNMANELPDADTGAQRSFDREVALGIVREAAARAQKSCNDEALGDHWTVFVRHHLDGQPYERIAPDMGVDRARCAVMARTAATRFKARLRALVAWEGATEEEIDKEIRQLLEVTGP